jgi:predicted MPP superfamily phosphohydrolase
VSRGRRAAVAVAAAVLLLAVWGVAIEPRVLLDVEHEQAVIPGLAPAWEGAAVGVISDLQIGLWGDNAAMVRRAVGTLVEQDPAVALVLGDFVYGEGATTTIVDTAVQAVRPLADAGIQTFAVLGNHDYDAGAVALLRDRLADVGITELDNESVALDDRPGPALHLAGIGPALPGEARPHAALDGVPEGAPRVVMMHNPATFESLPPNTAPLAVAGHTHGGQIRLPFLPEWSLLRLVQSHPVHADGWIPDYGAAGNQLYVNRGIGMSVIPMRVNCTPAVTVFRLVGG